MPKPHLRFLAIAFAFCGLIRAHGAVADKTNYLAQLSSQLTQQWPTNHTINIVFHGHSVVAGYFKTPKVDTFNAYPHLVHVALKEKFPNAVINCIVTAIGGENSEQGAERFERDVLSHRPDLITIDYSLNDRKLGVPRAEKAWRRMIDAAVREHIKVLLLTPGLDLKAKYTDEKDPLSLQAEMVRKLATEYQLGLVDSWEQFQNYVQTGGHAEDLMAQSNHPNRKGHELIAHAVMEWFP